MSFLSKRWLLAVAAVTIAAAVVVVGSQAFGGSTGDALAGTAKRSTARAGWGRSAACSRVTT